MIRKKILFIAFIIFSLNVGFSQNRTLLVEAESGTSGSDYEVVTESGTTFLRITTNGVEQYPESENRVSTFEVTFPDSGTYQLFVRLRVGAASADDDSYFYGNGFGEKDPVTSNDWITVNQLHSAGYNVLTDIVLDAGSAYTEIWKWVNMSMFNPGDGSLTFRVEKDNLTQTFQIGAREDGLDIDKLAFAPAGYYYTVENLDNGEEGSEEMSPGSTSDKPLADGRSKYVGCCYSSSTKNNFEKYWNQVVPENAGKWGSVEWARDNMNWSGLDEAYDFAKSHGFPFRFHVLVWGNQQPSWIETLSTSEQREEIEEWFQAVAGRYPDIDILEVVNEPLHDPPNQPGSGGGNYIDALGGTGSTGYDWIVEAFRLAREYFPASVKLMLNEYSLLNSSDNVREYKKIIDLLMAEELIDAVGMQGHAFSTYWASAATIKSNLDKLAETGLPLYVTEMDIDGPTDATQLNEYKKVFPVLWEHPAVKGITLWGFRTGMWRTDEKAYLINPDGTERPAMTWLREYIASSVSVPEWELASAYSVYPNPVAKGMVYIGNAQNVTAVKVIDISGRQLNVVHNAGLPVIAVEMNYRPGLYALQIESNGQTRVKKILVR